MLKTTKVMRTVVSVLQLDPRKYGSMEEYTVFLSRALRDRGWRSVLVFSRMPPEPVLCHFRDTRAQIETFSVEGKLRYYPSILRILRRFRGEVVHFHFFSPFSLLPLVARLGGARVIVFTEHVLFPQALRRITKMKLYVWNRVVLRLLDVIVLSVSEHIKRTLVNYYEMPPERIQTVLNGINLDRFGGASPDEIEQLRQELEIPHATSVVVSASNLRPEKGLSDLLRAARLILSQRSQTYFVIVGEGPIAGVLQREAEQLRIADKVRFTGSRSDVHRLMALADVVTVPSICQEAAGLVEIEAMGCRRPVVATRVGGIPEYVVDGETGILVQPGVPEQLARAIIQILDSPSEAKTMGQAGRKRAEDHFSTHRWVEETLAIFNKALA
jgi:glycosyltransferase involved in cell wall biosynthesis